MSDYILEILSTDGKNLWNNPKVSISSFTKNSQYMCRHYILGGPPGEDGAQGDTVSPPNETYMIKHMKSH